jgi:hypothetical protein
MSRESAAAELGMLVMDLINTLRDENLEWHEHTQKRRNDIRVEREMNQEKMSQDLQKLVLKFQQDIHIMNHDFQVTMHKKTVEAELDVKNYERFIYSIEDLRGRLEEIYPNMPLFLVSIIHEYATQLLKKMWGSPEGREKLLGRRDLVEFLALVYEDISPVAVQAEVSNPLPHRTLKYIREQKS